MVRFIEGVDRHQAMLLPEVIDDYLNQVQSSRRLERECRRNLELIWLTGRLAPDFKTIADFRRDNGPAIRKVCAQLVALCRGINLLDAGCVAIDGSKFKAVNAKDRNFTREKVKRRIKDFEDNIDLYLSELDKVDEIFTSTGQHVPDQKIAHANDRLGALKKEVDFLKVMEKEIEQRDGKQVSLTDPDARAMASTSRHPRTIGYNVQNAVDTKHHLIVAHEVTMQGTDRAQLEPMARKAREALGNETIEVLADRGYYSGEQIVACE